ncbi:hypothetical protein Q4543_11360 [Salipiger sp. 1_MG-2023]|uniref:hypothetical protein n=1 Tax=Salipiger sp. 1_MG-2023 TaxID=3062665 RepID=UPI0026E495CE|nr:hypothetical protein [Salipiger sp. 1_MG-2023]MDO6586121.1 hypothetical protein [Salipiger sp. 1_MG-2023]
MFELMNIESNIMTATMLHLALEDIPSYPVHDCLICKHSDSERVLEVLRDKLRQSLGAIPALDITDPKGICHTHKAEYPDHYINYPEYEGQNTTKEEEDFLLIDDDDYQVLEDFEPEGEEGKGIEEEKSCPEAWEIQSIPQPYQDPANSSKG